MKKITIYFFLFMLITLNHTSAMKFNAPSIISGNIEWKTSYPLGFSFSSDSKIKGEYFTILDKYNTSTYANGIAYFANDSEGLYAHFDITHKSDGMFTQGMNTPYIGFGTKNGERVYNFKSIEKINQIHKITTDSGVTLYMIQATQSNLKNDFDFMLLGKRNDGKLVRYFLMSEVLDNYLGKLAEERAYIKRWRLVGNNSVEVEYDKAASYQNFRPAGKFVFNWDTEAQWFSVKHIVY